jgi:hypothetical protein
MAARFDLPLDKSRERSFINPAVPKRGDQRRD